MKKKDYRKATGCFLKINIFIQRGENMLEKIGKTTKILVAMITISLSLSFAVNAQNLPFSDFQKQEYENNENHYNQQKTPQLQPYLDAIVKALEYMTLEHHKINNSDITTEELAKTLLTTALKNMAAEDKYGIALTPEEWKIFSNQQTESYFGIGVAISQIEKWTPKSNEILPIAKNESILKKYENTLIGMRLTAPNGKILETINMEKIPIGSELTTKTKIDNCNIREEKYRRT